MKLFAKLLAVIFVSMIIGLGWVWHRTNVLNQTFAQVQRGDSQARVIELFGQPGFVTAELQTNINWNEEWLSATNGIRCVRQFHYFPPFSICGESWMVGFDERSNAVEKYHFISP